MAACSSPYSSVLSLLHPLSDDANHHDLCIIISVLDPECRPQCPASRPAASEHPFTQGERLMSRGLQHHCTQT